jgi:mRNA interferase RelE/StbE
LKTEFKGSFVRDLKKIRDKDLSSKVKRVIEQVEHTPDIQTIQDLKKIEGSSGYYRIRIGDYRLGLLIKDDVVCFVRLLHRKDIYRYFP